MSLSIPLALSGRLSILPGLLLSLALAAISIRLKHATGIAALNPVVVAGSALVTRDAEEVLLRENESIYLPLGSVHRLENPGRIPLELIEVQSGSYLGEDDIVRYEDTYGRN